MNDKAQQQKWFVGLSVLCFFLCILVVWNSDDQTMSIISGNLINALNQRKKKGKDQKQRSRNRSKGLPCWSVWCDKQSFWIFIFNPFTFQPIDLVEDMDEDMQSLDHHMNNWSDFEPLREDWFSVIIHSSPTRQPSKPNLGNLQRMTYLVKLG